MTDSKANLSILFMTHCHSTPLYSHIHSDVPLEIASCPLITEHGWKSIVDRRRKEIWLNDDTTLLTEWPHLYLFKYFRYPINTTEFGLDSSYKDYIQNMWTTVYHPDHITPMKSNLTEKVLENSVNIKVYGIDRPMPSHIITMQGGNKATFHNFLLKRGYQRVKSFIHSRIYLFSENSELQYCVYRQNIFDRFYNI